MEEEEYLEDGIIELVDEHGNVVKFKLVDVTEYKGQKYTLLVAAEPNEEFDEDVYIFRLNEAEERLETIDDEALLEEVFEFYQNEAGEMDEADYGEEED